MEPASIRVVIVEDHAMVAESLAAAVGTQSDITIAAVAGSLRDGRTAVAREQPDVILMDYRLPDGNGIEGVPAMKEAAADAAVLLITAEPPANLAAAAVESGCAGLVPKGERVEDVVAAIRAVHRGDSGFSPELLVSAMRNPQSRSGDQHSLTDREFEVLVLLSKGSSTTEIADELVVSTHTVRNHIRNLTAKLGARSRLEAVAMARRNGIIDASDS